MEECTHLERALEGDGDTDRICTAIASTPEVDHGVLPRFRIRWAETFLQANEEAQSKLIRKLRTLLKKSRMELSHTDPSGFAVYLPRANAESPRRRRARGK